MPFQHLRGDVRLLRESISLIREFGLHSAERLLHVAEFLERSVYAPHSLAAVPGGVAFTLLNPPLRVGAFSAVRVLWDGAALPSEQVSVRGQGHEVDRPLTDVTETHPLDLRPGEPIRFRLDGIARDSGTHRVRLELQNVAVPPLVWFEFSDTIGGESPP